MWSFTYDDCRWRCGSRLWTGKAGKQQLVLVCLSNVAAVPLVLRHRGLRCSRNVMATEPDLATLTVQDLIGHDDAGSTATRPHRLASSFWVRVTALKSWTSDCVNVKNCVCVVAFCRVLSHPDSLNHRVRAQQSWASQSDLGDWNCRSSGYRSSWSLPCVRSGSALVVCWGKWPPAEPLRALAERRQFADGCASERRWSAPPAAGRLGRLQSLFTWGSPDIQRAWLTGFYWEREEDEKKSIKGLIKATSCR